MFANKDSLAYKSNIPFSVNAFEAFNTTCVKVIGSLSKLKGLKLDI